VFLRKTNNKGLGVLGNQETTLTGEEGDPNIGERGERIFPHVTDQEEIETSSTGKGTLLQP